MTALLAGIGLAAMVAAYILARGEAADFLDGQLRQVALNAGPASLKPMHRPPPTRTPKTRSRSLSGKTRRSCAATPVSIRDGLGRPAMRTRSWAGSHGAPTRPAAAR